MYLDADAEAVYKDPSRELPQLALLDCVGQLELA